MPWTSPGNTPPSPSASTMTLRSQHQSRGLFDKGVTDKDGVLSAIENQHHNFVDALDTSDPAGLFSIFDDDADTDVVPHLSADVAVAAPIVPARSSLSSESSMVDCSGLLDDNDLPDATSKDFLEVFTNIHDLLPQGEWLDSLSFGEVNAMLPEIESETDTKREKTTEKRSASKAFTSHHEEEQLLLPVNTDHDDYFCKIKRPRLSTASETTDSEFSASTSSGSAPKVKEEKYVERRRKNNIASRRSRECRKQKFVDMEKQMIQLEESNVRLEAQASQLEGLIKLLKDTLVQRLTSAK